VKKSKQRNLFDLMHLDLKTSNKSNCIRNFGSIKIEKTEKIKNHKQKKVEETARRIQNIAARAAGMAMARERTVRAAAVAAAIVDNQHVRKFANDRKIMLSRKNNQCSSYT
jgi:hypothetical protein